MRFRRRCKAFHPSEIFHETNRRLAIRIRVLPRVPRQYVGSSPPPVPIDCRHVDFLAIGSSLESTPFPRAMYSVHKSGRDTVAAKVLSSRTLPACRSCGTKSHPTLRSESSRRSQLLRNRPVIFPHSARQGCVGCAARAHSKARGRRAITSSFLFFGSRSL